MVPAEMTGITVLRGMPSGRTPGLDPPLQDGGRPPQTGLAATSVTHESSSEGQTATAMQTGGLTLVTAGVALAGQAGPPLETAAGGGVHPPTAQLPRRTRVATCPRTPQPLATSPESSIPRLGGQASQQAPSTSSHTPAPSLPCVRHTGEPAKQAPVGPLQPTAKKFIVQAVYIHVCTKQASYNSLRRYFHVTLHATGATATQPVRWEAYCHAQCGLPHY